MPYSRPGNSAPPQMKPLLGICFVHVLGARQAEHPQPGEQHPIQKEGVPGQHHHEQACGEEKSLPKALRSRDDGPGGQDGGKQQQRGGFDQNGALAGGRCLDAGVGLEVFLLDLRRIVVDAGDRIFYGGDQHHPGEQGDKGQGLNSNNV